MKEGTNVKVVAELCGHEFEIGDIVSRHYHGNDDSRMQAFIGHDGEFWFMQPDEYEVLTTKDLGIQKLTEALHACQDAKFSNDVIETICVAIDNAYDEMEEQK